MPSGKRFLESQRSKVRGFHLLYLFGTLIFLSSVIHLPLAKADEIPEEEIEIAAPLLDVWLEETTWVFVASEGLQITQGPTAIKAHSAVIWFDEAAARKEKVVTISAYAEGEVVIREPTSLAEMDKALFTLRSKGRLRISARRNYFDQPQISDLYQRAKEAKARPQVIPEARALVGPPPAKPPLELFPIDSDGFDWESWVEEGERISVITGGVEVVSGPVEIKAENMVVWAREAAIAAGAPAEEARVHIYAEGDVIILQDSDVIRARRIYYDVTKEQALIIDARLDTYNEDSRMHLYYRAAIMRQLDRGHFAGKYASLTTCEFGHPHFQFRARDLKIVERPAPPGKEGPWHRVTTRHNVALVYNIPVGYWYQLSRDIEETHYLLKKAKYYHSSRMGHSVETVWDLYDLGLQERSPLTQDMDAWSDLDLRLDYYGKRGTGIGLIFDYARPEVWGYFQTYYIHDRGLDIGDVIPATRNRYRIKWLQRAFLADNWQLDIEISRISDPTFLGEYYEEEFKEGKMQENIIYLKRQEDTRAFTFLYKFRLNNFFTQTEYLPQLAYYVIGEPLWEDRLTFYSRSEAARVRLRPADGLGLPSPAAWRVDTENEIAYPFQAGPFKMVPFISGRSSYFDRTAAGGSEHRLIGTLGLRASLYPPLWRIYDVYNRTLDVNRLRHIITPDITILHRSSTVNPTALYQFDQVDAVGDYDVVSLGLRQRLQTKRRRADRHGRIEERIVDFLILDAEIDYFPNAGRDNAGNDFSDLNSDLEMRLTDRTTLLSDAQIDIMDDFDINVFNIGVSLDRSPLYALYFGHRYAPAAGTSSLTAALDYNISEKWRLGLLNQYDFQGGGSTRQRILLTRIFHRWILEMEFSAAPGRDDTVFSFNFYPQGLRGRGYSRFGGLHWR